MRRILFLLLLVSPLAAQQTVTVSGNVSYTGTQPYNQVITLTGLPSGCVATISGFTITITGCPQSLPVGVSVVCSPTSVAPGATVTCSAAVTNAANLGVTWSSSAGVISSSGVLSTPTVPGTITVTARSVQDSTKSGSAAIAVVPPAAPIKVESESTTISSGQITVLVTNDAGAGSKLVSTVIGQTYDYHVMVPTAGAYVVAARLGGNAGNTGTGTVHFEFPAGTDISGPLSIFNPAWQTISAASGKMVSLPAGTQTIRMVVDALMGGEVATNWFSLTPTGQPLSIALMWNPSTSAVLGYNIYRGTIAGGPYQKINLNPIIAAPYVDTTILPGNFYAYVATAFDASGESIFSNEASLRVP